MVSRLLSLISGGYIIQTESTRGRHTQDKSPVVNPAEEDASGFTIWLAACVSSSYLEALTLHKVCERDRRVKGVARLSRAPVCRPLRLKSKTVGRERKISHANAQPHLQIQTGRHRHTRACAQHAHARTHTAGMDWCLPYSVVIYDRSSVEARVIWEMMAILI